MTTDVKNLSAKELLALIERCHCGESPPEEQLALLDEVEANPEVASLFEESARNLAVLKIAAAFLEGDDLRLPDTDLTSISFPNPEGGEDSALVVFAEFMKRMGLLERPSEPKPPTKEQAQIMEKDFAEESGAISHLTGDDCEHANSRKLDLEDESVNLFQRRSGRQDAD